jgi:hypothetical protein
MSENNSTNFQALIQEKRIIQKAIPNMLVAFGIPDRKAAGNYSPVGMVWEDLIAQLKKSIGSNGSSGATPVNYSNVLFVDPIHGVDATAIVGDFTKPYLTIYAALDVANSTLPTVTARALIYVRKGDYPSVFAYAYNNVDVYCEAGVVFSNYFYSTDQGVGITNFNWYGHAKWNLGMSQYAFRWEYASTVLIEGDSFVNTGAISLCYNVIVGTSDITYNFNSMESTLTTGSGYAFTWRSNCNGTLNVKKYLKSNQVLHDIRTSHSGTIVSTCPKSIMTAANVYGGNFKEILTISSGLVTSTVIFNGDLYNESPDFGTYTAMIISASAGNVYVNGNIYGADSTSFWNIGTGNIICNGGITSNKQCLKASGSGGVYVKNGTVVQKAGTILGDIAGTAQMYLTNVTLHSETGSDLISQTTNTSKIFATSVTAEASGGNLINATVAATVAQFTNCVSNVALSVNVTNELAQGLTIDPLLKTPKY